MALFRNLAPDHLSRLAGLLHHRSFPAETNILAAEQPGEVAYIILSGTVKIHVAQAESGVILAFRGAGDVIGEMSLVDSIGHSADVITMESCAVYWIDRASFVACLQTIPMFAYNLSTILSRRLRLAGAQIQSLATQDVYGRVARQLLSFAQEYGEAAPHGDVVIPLRLTQSDLADLVGASRVRVNQVLVAYKKAKHISMSRDHRITVHNRAALLKRCQ
jgi:CRP/FNR family cyclic AMP-dependent transcriptional regulator